MDKDLSIAIKNLRIPLALLIVFGHSDILHFPLMSGDDSAVYDSSVIIYPIVYLCRVLFAPANSLFFAISGYLFFIRTERFGIREYKSKIYKRILTLFLPYVIWQLVFLIPSVMGVLLGKHDFSAIWFFQSIWSTPDQPIPADPPLWFLRDLMVCMVLSPLFYLLLRKWWIGLLVLLTLIFCWLLEIWPIPQPNGFSSLSIIFFALGSLIGIHKYEVSRCLNRCGGGILCIFLIATIMDMFTTHYVPLEGGNVQVVCINPLNNVVILLACAAYPYLAIHFRKMFDRFDLGGSFVIYASHWGFLIVVNAIITRLCPAEIPSIIALLLFLLRVMSGFLGGLLLSRIISRNSYLLRLLAGGRI